MGEDRICQTECLVPGKKDRLAVLKTVLGLIGAIAGMVLAFSRESLLIGALGAAAGAFAYLSRIQIYREYEYTVSENTLSVDVIFSKKRRKPLVVWELENICLFAPEGSEELAEWDRQRSAAHDFSSVAPGAKHYCSVCRKSGRVTVSRLSPSPAFLLTLRQSLPRSVTRIPREEIAAAEAREEY